MQISKALTADTPEDRWAAMCHEVWPEGIPPEAVYRTIIEQFYLNERTLFIDMARYGPRTPSPKGCPSCKYCGPEERCISEERRITGHCPRDGGTGTASGSGQPDGKSIGTAPETALGPAGAASGPIDPEAVAVAIDALKLDASLWLSGPYFGRWMDLRRPDRYPADAVGRLAALRALTLPQLEYLRTGQGRPPI